MTVREIEASKIRTLERITVSGLQCSGGEDSKEGEEGTINVLLYNNEYYCIDDPVILRDKEKVSIKVITEVRTEEELYEEYLRNNVRNMLNPYKLLLLYKEGKFNCIAKKIKNVLERNITIDNELLRMLNEHLLQVEKKNRDKPIFISLSVLDAISKIEHYIEKGLAKEEIVRLIDEYINESKDDSDSIHYPTPTQIIAYTDALYAEEEEEEKREEERKHIEELKKEKNKDVETKVYDFVIVNNNNNIPVIATTTTATTDTDTSFIGMRSIENDNRGLTAERFREELSKILKEEGLTVRVIAVVLKYPTVKKEEIEAVIDRIVRRFIHELEKHGIMVSLQ